DRFPGNPNGSERHAGRNIRERRRRYDRRRAEPRRPLRSLVQSPFCRLVLVADVGGRIGVLGNGDAPHSGGGRRGRGCGTQGRSPRLSLALSIVMPSGSSHIATAPRRQASMRSMTGTIERQRKPAGTWLTIASTPPHLTGRAAVPVTIATWR